jgi:hypothetical protein
MSWYAFTVTPIVHGPLVAEDIRTIAADPLIAELLCKDAQVLRVRLDNGERFYFSPAAVPLFDPFIRTYGGVECNAPSLDDRTVNLLRLDVGATAVWYPIVPPTLPARTGREPRTN